MIPAYMKTQEKHHVPCIELRYSTPDRNLPQHGTHTRIGVSLDLFAEAKHRIANKTRLPTTNIPVRNTQSESDLENQYLIDENQ